MVISNFKDYSINIYYLIVFISSITITISNSSSSSYKFSPLNSISSKSILLNDWLFYNNSIR
nr:MAG TPA: hypothetical protein [Caudoviricetes sp.]